MLNYVDKTIQKYGNGHSKNLDLYASNNQLDNDIFTLHQNREEISIL